MSIIADEIKRGGLTGTDDEIAAVFAGNVPHYMDADPYDWARLTARLIGLGVDKLTVYALDESLLLLPGGKMFCRMLDKGVSLSNDAVRQLLMDMRFDQKPDTQSVLDLILHAGIAYGPLWQKLGLPGEPTAKDIAAAQQEIEVRDFAATVQDELFHDRALDGATIESLKAAIAAKE